MQKIRNEIEKDKKNNETYYKNDRETKRHTLAQKTH